MQLEGRAASLRRHGEELENLKFLLFSGLPTMRAVATEAGAKPNVPCVRQPPE